MNKKEYIILFSSLVFLIMVVAVGLIFFYPNADEPVAAEGGIEYVRETATDEEEPVVIIEQFSSPTLQQRFLESSRGVLQEEESDVSAPDPGLQDAEAPKASAPEPEALSESKESPSETAKRSTQAPKKETPAAVPRAADPQPRRETTRSVSRKGAPFYWVQLLATEDRLRILQARAELRRFGLNSLVHLYEDGDRNLYRLRVGPFDDKREAEKFMGWILSADVFSESYVIRASN